MAGKGAESQLCQVCIGARLVAFHVVLCFGVVGHLPGLTARFRQLWKLGLDDT